MEPIEEKVGIPESVVLNGVTYVVKDTPELLKFIQDVAKVEKSKLYSQFENLKTQINNLGKVRVEAEKSLDIDTIIGKLRDLFITKEDFKEALPSMLKEVVQPVLTATEQNRQDVLKQYREKLINENLDKCIPELVKGETKEELEKSLQESIRIRTAYPSPSTVQADPKKVTDPLIVKQGTEMGEQHTPTPVSAQPSAPAAPMTPPAAPRRPSPDAGFRFDVKKLSEKEFEQQRDNLRQQLESMYGDGML